jgi:hypothetical protein
MREEAMNDDMKRLCEAAWQKWRTVQAGESGDPPEVEDFEFVLRAILSTLPNLDGGPRYAAGEWSRRNIEALVADVLGE